MLAADYVARGYEGGVEAQSRHLGFRVMGTARSMEGAATLVLTGRYIGFLPAHYARHWVERGRMRALLPQRLSYFVDFEAAVRRGVDHPRPVRELLRLLGTPAVDSVEQHDRGIEQRCETDPGQVGRQQEAGEAVEALKQRDVERDGDEQQADVGERQRRRAQPEEQ